MLHVQLLVQMTNERSRPNDLNETETVSQYIST